MLIAVAGTSNSFLKLSMLSQNICKTHIFLFENTQAILRSSLSDRPSVGTFYTSALPPDIMGRSVTSISIQSYA